MRPILSPAGFHRRIPLLPHQMSDRFTRTEDVIVLCHLGVPRLSAEDWQLTIDGLVERELQLSWPDLKQFPKVVVESVHQCAGSPLQPDEPTRRITNVVWGGVRLVDVLAAAGVRPEATHVWSTGADYGDFEGIACGAYVKDIPVSRVPEDVLIAFELNGELLSPEHGFPVRLVVPGFYGTNSVKWLTRLTLASNRADGPFTTRWYNDPVRDAQGRPTSETRPVWSIAPESVISDPAPDATVSRAMVVTISGWSWSSDGVARVDISSDGGTTWTPARLEAASGRGWQAYTCRWTPQTAGYAVVMARATSVAGLIQPLRGARNAIHQVHVTVV